MDAASPSTGRRRPNVVGPGCRRPSVSFARAIVVAHAWFVSMGFSVVVLLWAMTTCMSSARSSTSMKRSGQSITALSGVVSVTRAGTRLREIVSDRATVGSGQNSIESPRTT